MVLLRISSGKTVLLFPKLTTGHIRRFLLAHARLNPSDRILRESGFPGSEMIPPGAAPLPAGFEAFRMVCHGHVISVVLNRGLALFAGLNFIPKRSFLTEYSCRITPMIRRYAQRMIIENSIAEWNRLYSHGCLDAGAAVGRQAHR